MDSATDYGAIKAAPLAHLDWFAEWGGRGWISLVRKAIEQGTGSDLHGQRLFELGPRDGRMACLFGLLGAEVVAADRVVEVIDGGRRHAEGFGISPSVRFVHFDGRPEELPERNHDIVFTKSVLVVSPDLDAPLRTLHVACKPAGKCVFIENGRGGPLLRLFRHLKHSGRWDYTRSQYIDEAQLRHINRYFDVSVVARRRVPPIFLLVGTRREVH